MSRTVLAAAVVMCILLGDMVFIHGQGVRKRDGEITGGRTVRMAIGMRF